MGIWNTLLRAILGRDEKVNEKKALREKVNERKALREKAESTQAWLRQYDLLEKRYTQSKPYEFHFYGCTSVPQDQRVHQFMHDVDKLYEITFPERAAETKQAWQDVIDFTNPKPSTPPTEEEVNGPVTGVDPWQPMATYVKTLTGPSPAHPANEDDGGPAT